MFLSYLILALSVSIDSLGIGITYGIRKTKITFIAKIILFLISLFITSISIYIGILISSILPEFFTKCIGIFLLIFMGGWVIFEALNKQENTPNLR